VQTPLSLPIQFQRRDSAVRRAQNNRRHCRRGSPNQISQPDKSRALRRPPNALSRQGMVSVPIF
jgi:hypothetical protein